MSLVDILRTCCCISTQIDSFYPRLIACYVTCLSIVGIRRLHVMWHVYQSWVSEDDLLDDRTTFTKFIFLESKKLNRGDKRDVTWRKMFLSSSLPFFSVCHGQKTCLSFLVTNRSYMFTRNTTNWQIQVKLQETFILSSTIQTSGKLM
jgi:hypothetical protein